MIRRPPRSTPLYSSAASDVYKRQAVQVVHCPVDRVDHPGDVRGAGTGALLLTEDPVERAELGQHVAEQPLRRDVHRGDHIDSARLRGRNLYGRATSVEDELTGRPREALGDGDELGDGGR